MRHRRTVMMIAMMTSAVLTTTASHAIGQKGPETYTATARVKTAAGAMATAPVTITVTRKMTQEEADRFIAAFTDGGEPGLRKALEGVPPTGSVRIGGISPTPTRMTLERPTDMGTLLTIVTDKPLLFLGGSMPGAKSTKGYNFAILDINLPPSGLGSGTLSPAVKVAVKDGHFAVDDYAVDLITLTRVTKVP